MRDRILSFLKKVYAALLRAGFFREGGFTRRHVNQFRVNRRIRRKNQLISDTFAGTSGVTLEEANYEIINISSENTVFKTGFDTLGLIRDLDEINYEEYVSDLFGILDNEEIDFRLALTTEDQLKTYPEAFSCFRERLSLIPVVPGRGYIIDNGRIRVAVFGFNLSRESDEDDPVIDPLIVKQMAYARNNGIDYIIAYAMRESSSSITSTPYERKYIRKLANLGCSYIFASNDFGIHNGGNIKQIDHTYSHVMISTGCLFGSRNALEKPGENAAVILRTKLLRTPDRYITNTGYIPLYNIRKEPPYKDVIRIDYHNTEHRRNDDIMAALTHIEDSTGVLRDIRNILTLNDICEILDVRLPDKYADIGNVSVGKVCSRSFEVNSDDVFFFRQPFEDPNDKDVKPLEYRMRSVFTALNRGALFIISYVDLDPSIPHIKIEDAREAHIRVCAELRKNYEVRTIGITGSIGKTSTKDMLYEVMSQKYETYRNLRNSNTQVNIGLHIQDFRGRYEVYIQEIGGGRPGGASRHSRMILPEATVITNIGHAHIGNYGTQEKLMESKLGIIDGMNSSGTLYLNGDDPLLKTAEVEADTVFYAVHNHNADYYADNIVEKHGVTTFEIVHGDHRVPAKLNVLGEYNVLNAVCCYAIGKKFKLTDEQIVEGLSRFETSGVRQNLISVGGNKLFVDCFNASPASIESSLSVLDAMETAGRKIAVIGDVTGMAELSEQIHRDIGEIVIEHNMDLLICYGEDSRIVYSIAKAHGKNAVSMTSPRELREFLSTQITKDDVVLFKGSSKMLLAERIDEVFGTMLSDQRYIDNIKFKKAKNKNITYNVYPEYATVTGFTGNPEKLRVAKAIRGARIYSLGDGAFANAEETLKIKIPAGIRHIGANCFAGCGSLTSLKMPPTVKFIDEKAFSDCTNIEKIELNEGIIHIGRCAFENCKALEQLIIPSSVGELGENVFAGCDNLTVFCYKNTYAEEYCREHGVEYKLI